MAAMREIQKLMSIAYAVTIAVTLAVMVTQRFIRHDGRDLPQTSIWVVLSLLIAVIVDTLSTGATRTSARLVQMVISVLLLVRIVRWDSHGRK